MSSCASIALIALFGGQVRAEEPDYKSFEQAAYLSFLNASHEGLHRSPSLGISFGERFHRATLDTGSTGVVVGATSIPNIDRLPKIADGELTYTSSGRIMRGRWVRTSFTILGAGDNSVQTEAMPVLAVDRVDCLPRARDCNPDEDVSRIAMIGIGFAREGDRQSQSTPDKNPFLHVVSRNKGQRHGYVLTSEGVHIGLSSANTAGPFFYVRLRRNADGTDWSPVPMCISINGTMPPACGTLLVDSGVSAAFMTVPRSQTSQVELQPGDQVAVSIPQQNGPAPLYAFSVGDGSPVTPEKIHLRHSPDRVFLNTSFHFLNGFDFLYDADGGYAGFRRR
ncbi:MAG: hypothetical protein JSR99_09870 [Proteobacteria bacterium]|nr:hypothetical protein [Pseudomonadota bacterium]